MRDYRICWPITDEGYTRNQLIDRAEKQVGERCAEQLLVPASTPHWSIRQAHEVPGWAAYAGSVLVAEMKVLPMPDDLARAAQVKHLLRERYRISA